jgi:two-component system, chemotaxis family, protein-glutamate methylesterase/glutaminase
MLNNIKKSNRIKVMVIDDSAVVRQVMTGILESDPALEVIGACADPIYASQRMQIAWPDVILLDVEMPRMDGITFLKKLMQERPTPVVICSTLTEAGAATTIEALSSGAVSVVAKPKVGLKQFLSESAEELTSVIRNAARVNVRRLASRMTGKQPVSAKNTADVMLAAPSAAASARAMTRTTEHVVALGTSTGGTQALEQVLTALPAVCPAIVIVQHMPPQFTGAFASRLNQMCELEIREARDNDRVVQGCALIAPGGKHMMLKRSGAQYYVEVKEGPAVNRHCPSVDVLFRSVAKCAGRNALGVIMTGMGDDGARGLKEMRDAGAETAAQDEASCVVFGMPKEAIKLDAAARILPLDSIPGLIIHST